MESVQKEFQVGFTFDKALLRVTSLVTRCMLDWANRAVSAPLVLIQKKNGLGFVYCASHICSVFIYLFQTAPTISRNCSGLRKTAFCIQTERGCLAWIHYISIKIYVEVTETEHDSTEVITFSDWTHAYC